MSVSECADLCLSPSATISPSQSRLPASLGTFLGRRGGPAESAEPQCLLGDGAWPALRSWSFQCCCLNNSVTFSQKHQSLRSVPMTSASRTFAMTSAAEHQNTLNRVRHLHVCVVSYRCYRELPHFWRLAQHGSASIQSCARQKSAGLSG